MMFTIILIIITQIKTEKFLIVFDDLITDIMTNKKLQATINKLFFRCRKLNVSFVFITQSYFPFPKELRLNFTHYLIMKIYNKREPRNIAINHSVDLDYKNVMNIYIKCTNKPYLFLTPDTTLPADNPLRFRKNLVDSL